MAVEHDRTIVIHDTAIHAAGMQIYAAVKAAPAKFEAE
jgi:hypothetical protein